MIYWYLYTLFLTKLRWKWLNRKLLQFRLKRFEGFLKRNSPYFKNSSPDLLMNKQKMMENFDQLNTVGISKDEAFELAFKAEKERDFSATINGITIGLSSGTSGHRGLFLASKLERNKWAGTILAKMLPASILTRQKVALFLRANSNLYQTVKSNHIQFEFFDLIKPIEENLSRLNQYQPTILIGPPAALKLVAKAQESKKININPRKIVSGAEVLDPTDRKYMAKVFYQIIHEVYQCTEGFLAATCEFGFLHFNEEFLIIEKKYIDKDKFHPIITDTLRTSQPIVKYELNDIITEDLRPCPCGSPNLRIKRIEGRSDDIFVFGERRIFPDFIRRAFLPISESLPDYRVIQKSQKLVIIETNGDESINQSMLSALKDLFDDQLEEIPRIEIQPFRELEPGEKLRRIVNSST